MTEGNDLTQQLDALVRCAGYPLLDWPIRQLLEAHSFVLPFRRAAVRTRIRCDALFLAPSASYAERSAPLRRRLEEMGLTSKTEVLLSPRQMLRSRCFVRRRRETSRRWHGFAEYVQWIVSSCDPTVIVTFLDQHVQSILLRRVAAERGIPVVNVSHAVLVPHPTKAVFDFDYYFVFGRSSIEAARRSPVRFGATRLLQVGNYEMGDGDPVSLPANRDHVLVFATRLMGGRIWKEYDVAAEQALTTIARWAAQASPLAVTIKRHPEDSSRLIDELFGNLPNVRILDGAVTVRSAIERAFVTIGTSTNAAIESAFHGRPYIDVLAPDVYSGHLDIEQFWGERVNSVAGLSDAVEVWLSASSDNMRTICDAFVEHHLSHPRDGLTATASAIAALAGASSIQVDCTLDSRGGIDVNREESSVE